MTLAPATRLTFLPILNRTAYTWTTWVKLSDLQTGVLPAMPGVYRIRPVNNECLVYLGQTSRSLDRRVRVELSKTYLQAGDMMPFNDPHTAAQSLWVWNQEKGWDYECSVAPIPVENIPPEDRRRYLEGVESFLLWRYHSDMGESPLCNHGRFHPQYTRSRNKKTGIRGGYVPDLNSNVGLPSCKPLTMHGNPIDSDWMNLPWGKWHKLDKTGLGELIDSPSIYRVSDGEEIVYIGQTRQTRSRMRQHIAKCDSGNLSVSVSYLDDAVPHHMLEMENDLIGSFIETQGTIPRFQFTNSF